jgi:hypothetical protein
LSLYLKYRPESFDDIIGNEDTIQVLRNQLARDSKQPISRSLLFHGPTGCGKTTLGRIVAQELGAKVTRKSRKDIMPKTPCCLLLSRLSLCCRAIFMKAGMARRLAFLGIVCRLDSRYGIQLTFCCGSTGIGRCKYGLWENENFCGYYLNQAG